MKVVIIGGVAGGATAAARLRRLDERAEIVILERSGYISYANCGLPYYIGGAIREKQALTLQTPQSFWKRFRIEARVHNEAMLIDPDHKTVHVRRLDEGTEYDESYDKLILSPGARAIRLPVPGVEDDRIMTLRTVEDTFRIRDYLDRHPVRRAAVIGGGFIGLEAAENLMERGVATTLIQLDDQVLPPLDYDMACQIHAYLRGKGLDLHLRTAVSGFRPTEDALAVISSGDEIVRADLVVMAVGVTPDTSLAASAGLALNSHGAIVVNERMETSQSDIYAVGDAVEIRNFVTGAPTLIPLAGPANRQGRIAADQICGRGSTYHGAQGTSIIKVFEMTASATGLNEKAAQAAGIAYDCVVTYSASHAAYYPGATDMTIKTLYDPESGKILGAQIVGFDGVDKRIDVMAAAIRAGMTAQDLEELDLAYAPSYSSAKDPVNMAGYAIGNVRSGLVRQYHWQDVASLPRDGSVTLLDVRTPGEYASGCIPGAVNIPLDELRERIGELDRDKPVYVNCFSGLRSYIACRILAQKGFACRNLSGGYRFYAYVAQDQVFDPTPTHPCGIKI